MKWVNKLLGYGLSVLMAFQVPVIPVRATEDVVVEQEIAIVQEMDATATVSGGDFVYDELCLEYDEEMETVTVEDTDMAVEEIVEAPSTYAAATATSGDFGVNNGLHWEYDEATKTVTISGEDVSEMSYHFVLFDGYYNDEFPLETEHMKFSKCVISGNFDCFCIGMRNLKTVDFTGLVTKDLLSMNSSFEDCFNLTSLDLSSFDTSNVTIMANTFNRCTSLTSVDVSGFDTSNVTSMAGMFYQCNNLNYVDVSGFDTSNVAWMGGMFYECGKLTSLDVSGFDTSKVVKMDEMFGGCSNLTSLDVSGFDTGKVTDMGYMFSGCSKLSVLDVSGFDTRNVTSMPNMFYNCSNLNNLDVSGFDTGNVTDMDSMFSFCNKLNNLDVSGFDTGNVTSMRLMFSECSSLSSLDVSGFDTGRVTNMGYMFSGCSNLSNLDVSGFDTGRVGDMGYMFSGCSNLSSLDVSGFETSEVVRMDGMFSGCSRISSLDLESFDTGKVVYMEGMFSGCSSLSSLDLSSFDTGNVIDEPLFGMGMCNMFSGCSSLSSLNLSSFDTHNITDMTYMFSGCSSLSSLDLSSFDTRNVNYMSEMFSGCSSLSSLDLSSFDTSKITEMTGMFSGCSSLSSLDLSSFDTRNVNYMSEMFSGCSSLTTLRAPAKMGEASAELPVVFVTVDGIIDIFLNKDYAGMTLHVKKNWSSGTFGLERKLYWMYDPETKTVTIRGADGINDYCSNYGNDGCFNYIFPAETEHMKFYECAVNGWLAGFCGGLKNLKTVDFTGLNTKNVTSMQRLFIDCGNLSGVNMSGFDTSNVIYMDSMFENCSSLKSLDLSSFDTGKVTNMSWMFKGCRSLDNLDVSGFDTDKVTGMSDMFYGCSSLSSLDLSSFNTANVTDMSQMFRECSSLVTLDLSSFDTGKVTSMSLMFDGCCSLATLHTPAKMGTVTAQLPYIFTTNDSVTTSILSNDFAGMILFKGHFGDGGNFGENKGLRWEYDAETKTITIYGEDIPNVRYGDTIFPNEVEHMKFSECVISGNIDYLCNGLQYLKTIDFTGLSTKKLERMEGIFFNCGRLSSVDISNIDTGSVTDMSYMFYNCSSLSSVDMSNIDTGSVTDMSYMFYNCSSLSSVDMSGLNTGNVLNMGDMFSGCSSLSSLDISSFDTSKASMLGMFNGCSKLATIHTPAKMGNAFTSLPAIYVTVDGVTTSALSKEFAGTTLQLQKVNYFGENNGLSWVYDEETNTVTISGEDVPNVSVREIYINQYANTVFPAKTEHIKFSECVIRGNMNYFFAGLGSLETVDFTGLVVKDLESMKSTFYYCTNLSCLDLSGLDTGNVTSMEEMFYKCSNLSVLDLSGFDTGNVTSMEEMFYGCSSLSSLDLSSFNTANVTDMNDMFRECSSLVTLDLSSFDTGKVKYMSNMFTFCCSLTKLDLSGFDTSNVTYMYSMFDVCAELITLHTPAKMGEISTELPATFSTFEGVTTNSLSKEFEGTTLYKQGFVPEEPIEPEKPSTPLTITSQPTTVSVFDGEQATFTIAATGDGLTYQWQLCYAGDSTFRKCTFTGADTATLTVDATKARNGYKFRCVVTNDKGKSLTSDAAILTVNSRALGVSLVASQSTADPGDKVTFTAQGNGGDGNYQYKFIINDTANDKWYKLQDFSSNNTIEWTATTAGTKRIMVDIRDGSGKTVGKNVSVLVNGIPELSAKFTASAYEVNSGDTVTLTAAAMGGSGKYNYKFIINDKTDDKWYRLQDFGTNNVITWKATTPGIKRLMVDVMDSQGRKFGTNITITVK